MVATSILDDLSSAQIDKKTAWSRIKTCQFLRNSLKENGPIKSLEQGLISCLSESKTIKVVKPSDKAAKPNKKKPIVGILHMKPMIVKLTLTFQSFNARQTSLYSRFGYALLISNPTCVIFSMQKKDLHYSRNDGTYGCQHRKMAFCQT